MPWVPLTVADVKAHALDGELNQYEAISNDAAAETKLPTIISHITSRVRGACLANPNLPFLGPAGTIPDFCVYHAAILVRHSLIANLPVNSGATELRKDDKRAADDFLKSIAEMDSRAFDPAPEVSSPSLPLYGGKPLLEF